jgi:hypothetical protein
MRINPKNQPHNQHAHIGNKQSPLDKKILELFPKKHPEKHNTLYKFSHHIVTLEKAPKQTKQKRY